MPVAPARAAAFQILLRIDSGAGHCDELLRSRQVEALSPLDRNLCTTLVMGVLRWQIQLDLRFQAHLRRPGEKLDPGVLIALRLGAFQIGYLDRVPIHAVIWDSVELAKSSGNQFAAGMVNAVLRKVSQAKLAPVPEKFQRPDELASAMAHPAWMVERWAQRYGLDAAEQICRFDQEPAPTTIRLLAADAEERLRDEGVELAPGAFLSQARTVQRGDVTATDTYRRGLVRIQDEASQLVAELAGAGLAGGRPAILDCCAAPGGKTAVLAERNPDSRIVACDVSGRRLEEMQRLLRHLPTGGCVEYQVADAGRLPFREEFDLVLCDVPCSGTGTLARNPEIRHRLNGEALQRHQKRQIAILEGAMRAVRPGGRLLYSTCSLEPEENEAVVEQCLDGSADFHRVPIEGRLEELVSAGVVTRQAADELRLTGLDAGSLRTLPGVHPCDGFFATLIIRK